MSKRHILHLAKWYPNPKNPLLGVFVHKHAKASAINNKVSLISIFQNADLEQNIRREVAIIDGLQTICFHYKKGLINSLKLFYCLWKEIQNTKNLSLIHAHVFGWPTNLAYLSKLILKTPYIVSEHWSGYQIGTFQKLAFWNKALFKKTAKSANQVLPVSQGLKAAMQNCGLEANYQILANVIDSHDQTIEKKKKNTPFTFIYVGDLDDSVKNISGIIDAFHQVIQRGQKDIRLEIIGGGIDENRLQKKVEKLNLTDFIHFQGVQNNDATLEQIALNHILLNNSNVETFAVVIAEALANGTPVIGTKCGGPEYLIQENNGILIEKNNVNDLAEAMLKIKSNYKLYNRDELQKSVEQYNIQAISAQLDEIYRSIN